MPGRDQGDRNTDWLYHRYFGDPRLLPRDAGSREEQDAWESYQQIHSQGSFLRTLATTGVIVGGGYLLGRSIPRDYLRHAFHALGQVGKDFTRSFQLAGREFAEELAKRGPYHPGRGPFLSDTGKIEYRNLELVQALEPILSMRGRMGATRASAVGRTSQTGMYTLGGIAEGHMAQKFLTSHPKSGSLQYATVADIFTDTVMQQKIGEHQFKVLKEARAAGLISDKFALAPGEIAGIYKDSFGRIIDSRWVSKVGSAVHQAARQIELPIIHARPADWIANLIRPYTAGKYFQELGGGLPYAPGKTLKPGGFAFGMAGRIYEESTRQPGLFREVAKGYKFFDAAETGGLLPQAVEALIGQHGLQRKAIQYERQGGTRATLRNMYKKFQDLLGVGSEFKTREHVVSSVILDPLARRKATLEGGAFVPYKGGAGPPGFGYISAKAERTPFLQRVLDQVRGAPEKTGAVFNRVGDQAGWTWRKAAKHAKVDSGDELRALFGIEDRGAVLSEQGFINFRRTGKINAEDLAVAKKRFFPTLGRRRVGPADVESAQAVFGRLSPYRKVTGFAMPAGPLEPTAVLGNYLTVRLNDLLSATLGFGFRPTAGRAGPLVNLAKIYGGYLGLRAAHEGAKYADYLVEDATGVSPWKTALRAYSAAREGLQHAREAVGLTAAAEYAEELMPGSVESPLSQATRFAYPPALLGLRRGPRGAVAGLALGGFIGWGDIAKSPEQVREELSGEELIPYRRSRWWMLGRQPFGGGQIDYFGPSWVARQLSDYQYTDSLYGSKEEYFRKVSPLPTPTNLFGLSYEGDEYLERKHYLSRPYPVNVAGSTRVQEMTSLAPTAEPDLILDAGQRLGLDAVARQTFEAEPASGMGDFIDRITQQGGIYKFLLWKLPGFSDDLAKRGQFASSDAMSSHSRFFYDDQMGGMLGLTEMYRRFVPDEKSLYRLNTIPNTMPDWLPGTRSVFDNDRNYYIDYTTGDPYTKIRHGEARLPGGGYDRLHRLHSQTPGVYDPMDRFLILADVAPYSQAYRHYRAIVQGWSKAGVLDVSWRDKYQTTMNQVKDKLEVHAFQPRRFTGLVDASAEQLDALNEQYSMPERMLGGIWETLAHDVTPKIASVFPLAGPILGDKLAPIRSPVETYKKWELYGEDFADWTKPWEGFIRPKMHEMFASDPGTATVGGAMLGVFGSNPLARLFLGTAGAVGLGASSAARVAYTGQLTGGYIPEHRENERALKEYLDKIDYVKNRRLEQRAQQVGDRELERHYNQQAGRTVTGLDYTLPLHYFKNQARAALDKRERAYFDAFVDVREPAARREVLSIVPDYVKPIYQAAWSKMGDPEFQHGARVAQLTADQRAALFFRDSNLPDSNWAGWHPGVPMSVIRVKAVDSAASSTALDKHRFGLWGPQSELAYREYPELDVSVIDLGQIRRQSPERQAFLDQLHKQGMEDPEWQGSLSAESISWDIVPNYTRRAMQYAGSILG